MSSTEKASEKWVVKIYGRLADGFGRNYLQAHHAGFADTTKDQKSKKKKGKG